MVKHINCIRCKKQMSVGTVCQDCKSDLLYFYEATQDWHLALELESQQQFLQRYQKDTDISEIIN